MLELFVIFSKSGIVLFATVSKCNFPLEQVVNGLVKHVFLEQRTSDFQTDQLHAKYLMDNEFELVFVVAYQKFLKLTYVDKFLSDVQLAFRDRYSNWDLGLFMNTSFAAQRGRLLRVRNLDESQVSCDFANKQEASSSSAKMSRSKQVCGMSPLDKPAVVDFMDNFQAIYEACVKSGGDGGGPESARPAETMRTFQESAKSKKTIASMIVQPGSENKPPAPAPPAVPPMRQPASVLARMNAANKTAAGAAADSTKVLKKAKKEPAAASSKKGKAARQWDLGGSDPSEFDFSKKPPGDEPAVGSTENLASINKNVAANLDLKDLQTNLEMTDSEEEDEQEEDGQEAAMQAKITGGKSSYFSSIWKSLSQNMTLTEENLKPVLSQLREHLTSKNVAAEIAEKLCESVGAKLKGLTVSSWVNLNKFARDSLEEAILRILNPDKNINILREIQAKVRPPYVIVFCGVNGVGKSTNLAKIANWLIINNIKVLIVACDTFRAGAIEQLKTHVMALKSLHERGKNSPVKIELFEKGYKKDSAAIAMEAINYARANQFNCVMVDTAGRMQDNEPLMRELAKLIKVNTPDLTLFVGEALVGNEAVDQLSKFNNSLIDCGCRLQDSSRSAISGIVLTKFDTIDDQVGAAISMTYVTGQPIVFVGVGQTYKDLKHLDAKAVTKALMR